MSTTTQTYLNLSVADTFSAGALTVTAEGKLLATSNINSITATGQDISGTEVIIGSTDSNVTTQTASLGAIQCGTVTFGDLTEQTHPYTFNPLPTEYSNTSILSNSTTVIVGLQVNLVLYQPYTVELYVLLAGNGVTQPTLSFVSGKSFCFNAIALDGTQPAQIAEVGTSCTLPCGISGNYTPYYINLSFICGTAGGGNQLQFQNLLSTGTLAYTFYMLV